MKKCELLKYIDLKESKMDRKNKKVRTGVVVSNKMDKSVVVLVETRIPHPLYKRTVRHSKKYVSHDEGNTSMIGDIVRIVECRPISRLKRWRLLEVVKSVSVA